MRSKKLLIVVLFALGITFIQANDKVVKFRAESIHCGGCANKVKKNLSAEAGILNVGANPETKEVQVEYDAAKVSSQEFKGYFKKFDYTITRSWESEKVRYASFKIEQIGDHANVLENSLKDLKGVLDFTVNGKTNAVAVAYNKDVLTEESLAENIRKNNVYLVASNYNY